MKNVFLFNLNGALCSPRRPLNFEFKKWFKEWMRDKETYIITGCTYKEVLTGLSRDIASNISAVLTCDGNSIYVNGEQKWFNVWQPKEAHTSWLNEQLSYNPYTQKLGKHIILKTGMLSFSVLGTEASIEQRSHYKDYDFRTKDRIKIVNKFNQTFSDAIATVAGETSINICPPFYGREHVVDYFDIDIHLHFFTNQSKPNQLDNKLHEALLKKLTNTCYNLYSINTWRDTKKILMELK